MARQCLVTAIRYKSKGEASAIPGRAVYQLTEATESLDAVDGGLMCEELEKVIISADAEKYFQVGIQLPPPLPPPQ